MTQSGQLLAFLAAMPCTSSWRGRQLGSILQDPVLLAGSVGGLLHGIGVIANHTKAMNMEWNGFFKLLQPAQSRS